MANGNVIYKLCNFIDSSAVKLLSYKTATSVH